MPIRWGSSESRTTPMPSFLSASVSSYKRKQNLQQNQQNPQPSPAEQVWLTFRMFWVSFHLLVHSLVSSRT